MNMRSLMIFTGILTAILLVSVAIYRLVNIVPPGDLSIDAQATAILGDASCRRCHQREGSRLPSGYLYFDMDDSIEKIARGETVNETVLAKIEQAVVVRRNMPPAGYYLLSWGASVTPAKRKILREWIDGYRERRFPNPLAAKRFRNEPVRPLPPSVPVNERKAALGKKLFHDARLSQNNALSCASCHRLDGGGADSRQLPEGVGKILGRVNTPTVFNAFFNAVQFRDGRAPDLKVHVAEHLLDPLAMAAGSFDNIVGKLSPDSDLKRDFDLLYHDGITGAAVIDALEAFEKTLITPNCRFDSYLKGKSAVLSRTEIRGYGLFKSNSCATCHAGVLLGGLSCERMGIYRDYWKDRGWEITSGDWGRFNHTADEADRYRFKVPGLRNVALTKPYFHDGSCQTLSDAVKAMAVYQSGRPITDRDAAAIAAFLETLTGEYKK